jgi:phosphatidylinositol 4-phosphatase
LSTLNNQTRDPRFNYGVQITYLATRQDTRVTSYSIRNQYIPDGVGTQSPSGNGKYGDTLSRILSSTPTGNEAVSVAFKSLPVDPQTLAGEDYSSGASTPKDAVDRIAALLVTLCGEFGVVDEGFLVEKDIVR